VEADRITIETAPGTRITVLRSTIARRLTEHPEEEAAGWSEQGGWSEQEDDTTGSGQRDAHQEALSDAHHEALSDAREDEDHHGWDDHEVEAENDGDAAASGEPGVR
jgi:hypothetical protein